MQINVHAHVFTLKSVFTPQTLEVLLNRLRDRGWPDFLVDAAEKAILKVLKGEYLDEQQLLREIIEGIKASDRFDDWIKDLGDGLPGDVQVLAHTNLDDVLVGGLRDLLHKLGDALSRNGDIKKGTVQDFLGFLLLGIRSSIQDVSRILIDVSGEDTVVVALMMDITDGKGKDQQQFEKQMTDTARSALFHPGRLIPFVAVNPRRPLYYETMVKALRDYGFAGVKMYPSLGYPVCTADGQGIDPKLAPVFDYCAENDYPILLHCNRGGFYEKKSAIEFADPDAWRPVLAKHPKLRVCFAHFGGDENLVQGDIPAGSWTAKIIRLMEDYENVYTDIAYHTECMDGGTAQASYFKNLRKLLNAKPYMDRILFGSDFYMVRLRCREENLWHYFRHNFTSGDDAPGEKHWKKITETNPLKFLGLKGGEDGGPRNNILSHVRWIAARPNQVGAIPPDWVRKTITGFIGAEPDWKPNPYGDRWNINNDAHYRTAQFFSLRLGIPNVTFLQIGGCLTRELAKYPMESAPDQIKGQYYRGLASRLLIFLTGAPPDGPGATLEPGVTQSAAKASVAALLANPEAKLYEFGPLIDQLLHFRKEDLSS